MKRIAILGGSLSALKVIEEIRASGTENEIIFFSPEGQLPYDQNFLISFLNQETNSKQIFYKAQDFYKEQGVGLILDKKFGRVNFRRNQITTEEKEAIAYDVLVIADVIDWKLPDIKGNNKTGVFGFNQLTQVNEIIKMLPLIETVTIQAVSPTALSMAAAFKKLKKEVLVISSGPIEADLQTLEAGGIQFIAENSIAEILGDADAKAIRLKSGKVFASDLIVFEETRPNWKAFDDTPLKINERIIVDAQFKTSVNNVYALGRACESSACEALAGSEQIQEQAKIVGLDILGQPAGAAPIPEQGHEQN